MNKNEEDDCITIGDVVRLNSGSPKMTVVEMRAELDAEEAEWDAVECVWFDGGPNLLRAWFPYDAVYLIPPRQEVV